MALADDWKLQRRTDPFQQAELSSNIPVAAPASHSLCLSGSEGNIRLHIVTSDAFAPEKLEHMKILGWLSFKSCPVIARHDDEKLTKEDYRPIVAAETEPTGPIR